MSLVNKFSKKLKKIRTSKGLSREALAERCGLHRNTIAAYERGRREPDLSTLEKISKGLEVDFFALTKAKSELTPREKLSLGQRYIREAQEEIDLEESKYRSVATQIYSEAVKHKDSNISSIPEESIIKSIIAIIKEAEMQGEGHRFEDLQ